MTDTLVRPAVLVGPRYSFAPIDRIHPTTSVPSADSGGTTSIYEILNVSKKTVYRWRANGMTTAQADHAALALSFHPVDLWPSWYEDAALEPPCRWCGELLSEGMTYCSREHRKLIRREDERLRHLRRKATT